MSHDAPDSDTQSPVGTRLCVIDAGTNSFHALIVDVLPDGRHAAIDRLKVMVRLGEHGLVQRRLPESSIQRGLDALARIKGLAASRGVDRFLAFATSAIRETENSGELIARARSELGVEIRTISSDLEAELIYRAVRQVKDLSRPTLIADIGGGSAELIIGTGAAALFTKSLPLGAGRLTKQFVTTDPVSQEELGALQRHCREYIAPVAAAVQEHNAKHMVGCSGTLLSLVLSAVRAAGNQPTSLFHVTVPGAQVRAMMQRIVESDQVTRAAIPGIEAGRVNQIVPGAVLTDILIQDLGIQTVSVSPAALREGMVQYFIEGGR